MLRKKPTLPVQQLIILSICRFAEPVVLISVLPYFPEMMEEVGVPKTQVAKWVGIASATFAGCQCIMAILWGRLSDYIGRKPIILFGLSCTMIFSLVFGFSSSLTMVIISRGFLGLMNGNVGIMRTMVAEMVPERELQPRAFSILPLVWTIGSIFGPAFGGTLANPAQKYPEIFGRSDFLKRYPFALPNIVASVLFIIGIATGFLFLEETLESKKDRRDYGLVLGQTLTAPCARRRRKTTPSLKALGDETSALLSDNSNNNVDSGLDSEHTALAPKPSARRKSNKGKPAEPLRWRDVFSPQSNLVLLAYGFMALHSMAFDTLFPVFLHHPKQELVGNPAVQLPFKFAGGFGVDSQTIGILYTLVGIIGMLIQFLIFPVAARRYGVLNCFKVTSIAGPILYFLTPFTVLVPPPIRDVVVFFLMLVKLATVIFSFPSCTILLTNSATSLLLLGTLNGVGTSASAVGRALGPAIVGSAFSLGIEMGYVILPWWILAALGVLAAIPVFWVVETEGFANSNEDDGEETDEDEAAFEETSSTTYGAIDNHPFLTPKPSKTTILTKSTAPNSLNTVVDAK
ncbi:Major facilitator superfamily domain containing protein [Elaphomyces granulatus]